MMWALARWQCLPPKAWLRQLDQVLLSRLQLGGNGAHAAGQAPGQDSSMHRVGKLAMASNIVPMPPRTMGQASHEQMANPTSRSHNAAAALTNSNSLASTGRSAGAAGLKRAQPANVSGDAPVRPLQLHLRETATLLWSLTRLRHKPPPALVHALEHAALQHLAHGSPADLAMLVWAFGGLRYNASNRFWAAFLRRTHAGSFVAAARPAELAAWAYGMGRIALPVPLTWAGAFAAQLQSQLPEMSGRGLVGVLKFLAGAQYTLPAQHARGQMPTSHSIGTLDRRLLRRPLEGRSLDGSDELAAASSAGLASHSNVGGNAYLSSPGVAAQQQQLLPRPGGVLRPLGLKARLQHPQQQQVRESVQSPQSQHASTSSRSIVNKNMSAASLRREGGADPLASAGSIRHCLHAALQHSVAHALSTRNLNLLANAAWAAARARIRMPRSWLAVLVRALSVLLCTSDTLPTPQTTVMLLWSLAKLLPGRNLDSRWRVPALNKGWAAAAAVAASATTISPAGTAILTLARERQQGSAHAIPHVQFKLFGPAEHNKRLMRQGSRSKQGHRQARRPGQGSGHRIGKMSSQSTTAVTHPNRKQRAERALSAGWLLMRLRARMQEQSWSPIRMLSAAAANNLTTVTASATAFSTATLAGGQSAQLLMTPAALCTGQVIVMGGPDGCRKYATPVQGLHISQRCAYKLLQSLSVHAAELPVPLLRRAVYGVSMLGLSPGHGPAARHAVKGLYSAVRQRVVSSLESAAFEQGSGVEQGGQERVQLEYTAAKVQQWYKAVCV